MVHWERWGVTCAVIFLVGGGGGRWSYTTLAVVCHEMCVWLPPCNVYLQCLLVTIVVLIVVVVVVEFDWTGNPILLFYVMFFSNLAFYRHIT